MRITKIENLVIKRPVGPPETASNREWSIVLIHTDQGLEGIGRGGDPRVIERHLAPLLCGRDPRQISQLWEQMYEAVWRGPGRTAERAEGIERVWARQHHVGRALGL